MTERLASGRGDERDIISLVRAGARFDATALMTPRRERAPYEQGVGSGVRSKVDRGHARLRRRQRQAPAEHGQRAAEQEQRQITAQRLLAAEQSQTKRPNQVELLFERERSEESAPRGPLCANVGR